MEGQFKQFCGKGPEHADKQIVMVCLNQECQAKRLCCLVCIDQLHRKHELISLYKFEEMLAVLTQPQAPDLQQDILGQLAAFESHFLLQIDQAEAAFARQIDKHRKKLQQVMAMARESVCLQLQSSDLRQIYRNMDNEVVCKYLALAQQAEANTLRDPSSTAKTLGGARTLLDRTLGDCDKLWVRGLEDLGTAVGRLKGMLGSQGKACVSLLSRSLKHSSLQVSGDQRTVKRFEGAGGYPIVLLEHPLDEVNCEFQVRLKEQPGNRGCWLGVCVASIVQGLQFKSCYGIGKGTWGIDQVGASHQTAYSWNHHDTNFNSQPKVGFTFQAGDLVSVRVDFKKSTVIFGKAGLTYEMPIQTHLGDIHGFVGCTYLGDVWEIPASSP